MTNEKKIGFVKKYGIIPKLVCLFAAFGLWLYVSSLDSADFESTFTGVTVSLENASVIESESSLYVYSGYGSLLDVTVKGQKSVVRDYTAEDIRLTADLSSIKKAGDYFVPVSVSLPNGLTLSGLSSDTVSVHVDEKSTMTIDVSARMISGTVAENYELGELVPRYNTINVTGPLSVLDKITGAQIRLSLGAVTSSMTATGQIELVSADGSDIDSRYLTLSRTEMEVSVPLYTYKSVPLTVDTKYGFLTDDNSTITLTPDTVLLKGDPAVLSRTDSLNVATLDEKSLTGVTSTRVADIITPEGITVADGTTRATVRVEHIGTVTKNYKVEEFRVIGADGIKYTVDTDSVNIILRGTLTDIGKTTANNITATVDLSDYTNGVTGSITVPVAVTVSTADVYELGEYTVQVTIG